MSEKKAAGVTHKQRPAQAAKSDEQAQPLPTMLGQTSPTDENVEVRGHTRDLGDGDTGRAFGGGLMTPTDSPKSVSAVTRDYIAKQNPALNPMQLVQLLPGANVSDSDPLGMTGGNMSVRGLTDSQMGFTLEGFPINDIGNFAVYPQEIVDAENLKTVRLAQGSADLDSPHISASGGVVDMYMIDPKKVMGGHVDMTYGSYNATRGFARFDTGYIGNTNLRAYFSYSQGRQDHWRGPGWENKKHGEMKIVNDWGDGNRISLAVVGNSLKNNAYPSVTKASWDRWGIGFDNPVGSSGLKSGDPANTVYERHYVKGDSNYYKLRPNPFTNIYASMPSTFKLTDHLVLTETPYFW
ncbi:TonB-dependent receptor plug domain-containing protein, partial [Acetobacter tropicalis]|uniref:TonB-dependent receptor plug domain-containing protein n=1 Tax=Acetobacter tropicalis TaxID=104102 RepID=UPI0035D12771